MSRLPRDGATPPVTGAGAMQESAYHVPVLRTEMLALVPRPGRVLDGTLGGGGHTLALLEAGADVDALDRDAEAVAAARAQLAGYEQAGRLRLHHGNFSSVDRTLSLRQVRFDTILIDLGVSSHQLDAGDRGFTYRPGASLDMRMGDDAPLTAAALLNEWDDQELAVVFREYGDEPRAGRLAREIVRRRARRPFTTSDDLVGAIRATLGPRSGPADFARLFQSVRIAVNDELSSLARALPDLRDRLAPGGILIVVAYHSGEDRLVKGAFREWSRPCICPPRQPICTCRGRPLGEIVTRRAVVAGPAELSANPRSRSARLRAWRRAR